MVRDNLCDTGSLSIGKLLETHIKKHLLNAFFNFHTDFVQCLAYGCFTELDIGYVFLILRDIIEDCRSKNHSKFIFFIVCFYFIYCGSFFYFFEYFLTFTKIPLVLFMDVLTVIYSLSSLP